MAETPNVTVRVDLDGSAAELRQTIIRESRRLALAYVMLREEGATVADALQTFHDELDAEIERCGREHGAR